MNEASVIVNNFSAQECQLKMEMQIADVESRMCEE